LVTAVFGDLQFGGPIAAFKPKLRPLTCANQKKGLHRRPFVFQQRLSAAVFVAR
jgi:hypothetical protein